MGYNPIVHTLYAAHIFTPIDSEKFLYLDDGGLLVDEKIGTILAIGKYDDLQRRAEVKGLVFARNNTYIDDYIFPGFIDAHIHYPQANLLAAPGANLLEWLENSIFPGELRMRDNNYARQVARFLLHSMLSAGTTTALIYGVTFLEAMNIFCLEAEKTGFRAYPGKMLMDTNAPKDLLDTSAEKGYKETQQFIKDWHGRGNIRTSIALRFALTSTPQQMRLTSKLLDEYPDLIFQTHLNESEAEINDVLAQNPDCHTYLGVYDEYGLHRKQSVYGHCVHMHNLEREMLRVTQASVAHCPCSNLYLGSGIADLKSLENIKLGLGSDIGAGYTYSILENAKTTHVLQKLNNYYIPPAKLLYLATLGGAEVLRANKEIGSLEEGKKADFTVISPRQDKILTRLLEETSTVKKRLHQLILLHNPSHIRATFIDGYKKYSVEHN